jgi:hypothetical protein
LRCSTFDFCQAFAKLGFGQPSSSQHHTGALLDVADVTQTALRGLQS